MRVIKKIFAVLLSMVLILSFCIQADAAKKEPIKPIGESAPVEDVLPKIKRIELQIDSDTMSVDGNKKNVISPYEIDGVAMIPLRALSESLGADVEWDGETRSIIITMDFAKIELQIDSTDAYVDGEQKELLRAPELTKDTTMIPLRFVSESFGADVMYYPEDRSISVVLRKAGAAYKIDFGKLEECKKLILTKTLKNGNRFGAMFPEGTNAGQYRLMRAPGWVGGFYTGLNYICYEWSGNDKYVKNAKMVFDIMAWLLENEPEYYHHDLGFTFMLSYYQDYLNTNNEKSKQVVINAADVLLGRVKEPYGYIQAWEIWGENTFALNNEYRMIVDTMCNISLLYTATELTGDDKYKNAASAHAQMTQQYLVRDDFTTTHTFVFDEDGNPRFQQQYQGAADRSCWARGQSWVINGMAQAYKFTGDESFLQTAKDCADTYFKMTDKDLISRWDLVYTDDIEQPKDTSAAAITACGLMDIWEATGDDFYKDTAYKIWSVLYDYYSTKDDTKDEGLIREAVGHKPGKSNITVSLIYGDYYFAQLTQRFLALK